MPETSSLIITALGGALGALLLRAALKLTGALLTRRKPLAVYDCGIAEKVGVGDLRHGWGHAVDDPATKCGKAWQYDSSPYTSKAGEHTIFGPYVNDFGKPGFYRVSFGICGKGFSKTMQTVVSLDVVQARFGTELSLRLLGQRIIRAKELSGKYQRFDVICHVPGTGVYEYRCAVVPKGINLGERVIRFDRISVYQHPEIWNAL